jgi:hypothetical protein
MNNDKKLILMKIASTNEGIGISMIRLDRYVTCHFPELIYSNEFKNVIIELENLGYVKRKPVDFLTITELGKFFLENMPPILPKQ